MTCVLRCNTAKHRRIVVNAGRNIDVPSEIDVNNAQTPELHPPSLRIAGICIRFSEVERLLQIVLSEQHILALVLSQGKPTTLV